MGGDARGLVRDGYEGARIDRSRWREGKIRRDEKRGDQDQDDGGKWRARSQGARDIGSVGRRALPKGTRGPGKMQWR